MKLNIGGATFHDSLTTSLTLNKGLNVNGTILQNGISDLGVKCKLRYNLFTAQRLDKVFDVAGSG